MNRRQQLYVALLLFGAALGATLAYWAGRRIQLETGRDELRTYAHRLLEASPQLVTESDRAVAAVLDAHLPFCSDEELALIRDYVYNAVHVRHIGRISGGLLHCTSGVGRLVPAEHMPRRAEISIDGLSVYRVARIVISNSASDAAGLVVEQRGVSIVMNPNSYRALDESPRLASGFLFDPANSRAVRYFGRPVALSDEEIASGSFAERDGIFMQPSCAKSELICVVASERQADILATGKGFLRGFLFGGMMLGGAASFIAILLHRRHGCMERQLRRAIRSGGLSLVYQPIIDLDSGTVVGAEALVRWANEAGQPVSPETFIALAEDKGFVGEITSWVLHQVTRELGDMLVASDLAVTVNVSARDLGDPAFFETLEQCLRSARLAPAAIGLEITERSTVDHETAIDGIARLKQAGHAVYVDDFGTGFSNLSYLHRLAADAIKIDRVFTKTVGTSASAASIVPQMLAMARQLGLRVVVEGIETREQAEYFRTAATHVFAQGYLFSPGVPAADIRKIFSDRSLAGALIAPSPDAVLAEYARSTAA